MVPCLDFVDAVNYKNMVFGRAVGFDESFTRLKKEIIDEHKSKHSY